jgi:hypothetical protein
VANTLIGIHRAVLDYVRQRITADPAGPRRLAQALQADCQKALDLLAAGLAGYGVRPPPGPAQASLSPSADAEAR